MKRTIAKGLAATMLLAQVAVSPVLAAEQVETQDYSVSNDTVIKNIMKGYANQSNEWWENGVNVTFWQALAMGNYNALGGEAEMSPEAKQIRGDVLVADAVQAMETADWATDGSAITPVLYAVHGLNAMGYDPSAVTDEEGNEVDLIAGIGTVHSNAVTSYYYEFTAPYVHLAQGEVDQADVDYMVAQLGYDWNWGYEWDGWYYASYDLPAMLIQGLAPFYADATVKTAVDAAVEKLSEAQNGWDGSIGDWGSVGTDTEVVIALAMLGINPNTDPRFVKNDVSLWDAMTSWVNEDQNGFPGWDGSSYDEFSTMHGVLALIAGMETMNSGMPYNPFALAGTTPFVATQDETTGGTGGTGGSGGSTGGTTTTDITVYVTVATHEETWLNKVPVEVATGEMVYHALKSALEDADMENQGLEQHYIQSLTYNGVTLSAFDFGANSGWMYQVNGESPSVGIGSYTLTKGDEVLLYYTTDWSVEDDSTTDSGNSNGSASSSGLTSSQTTEEELEETEEVEEHVVVTFADMADHWAKEYVETVLELGLMTGVSDEEFAPDVYTNRAMVATVLHRMAGELEVETESQFTDVDTDTWYSTAVAWVSEMEITTGVGDNRFAPDQLVTREELATLLYRYGEVMGLDLEVDGDLSSYEDADSISDWAVTAMTWANAIGLVTGTSETTLSPTATATRGELATLLTRYLG